MRVAIFLVLGVLIQFSSFTSEEKSIITRPQEYREVRIYEHSEKESFVIDRKNKSKSSKSSSYIKDQRYCSKLIYEKGGLVNGKITADYKIINDFIIKTTFASLNKFSDTKGPDYSVDHEKDMIEVERIIRERKECMSKIGWVERIDKVLNE